MVTATLKNYRQSPRKVRLIADEVRGKTVVDAITKLSFVPNRAAEPIKKLLESAVANAKNNHSLNADDLFIKTIVVDEGFTMKRWIPKWRGTAHPIRKRTSHIKVVLDEKKDKVEEVKKEVKKVEDKKTKTTKTTKKAKTKTN